MIRLWANIANKLGISQEAALLLHGLLRGWLNQLARRRAYIIVTDIVDRFSLEESDFEITYAKQLLAKGILTPTEAEVFAGNYYGTESPPRPAAQDSAGAAGNGAADAATGSPATAAS